MTKFFFFILLFLSAVSGFTQELNCTVSLRTDQIRLNQQGNNNQQIFNDLQAAITDFVNGRRWTTDNFQPDERIKLDLSLVIQKASASGDYEAQATIQVLRPIFGTSYEAVLLRYVDRTFSFRYLPDNPLNFNDNVFTDNLTSLLAFYSYVALALDYDSFSKRGGEVFIQRAYNVATIASGGGGSVGWDSRSEQRSRYWLIENLQNQQMQPFREGIYTYHRLGMDVFNEQPEQARKQILGVLNDIKQVNALKPAAVLVNSFFDAKGEEIVSVFANAPTPDKRQAYAILVALDPTKTENYKKLLR